jgi:hypothetical protein
MLEHHKRTAVCKHVNHWKAIMIANIGFNLRNGELIIIAYHWLKTADDLAVNRLVEAEDAKSELETYG